MSIVNAYAWRSGRIEFGKNIPEGALLIASVGDDGNRFKKIVAVLARHSYDGKMLLVPGIPEAASENAALEALTKFTAQVLNRWVAGGVRRSAEAK